MQVSQNNDLSLEEAPRLSALVYTTLGYTNKAELGQDFSSKASKHGQEAAKSSENK